jgi:hypothetical protein
MRISKFFYISSLVLLGWAAAGHATVVTKLVAPKDEEKPALSNRPTAETQKADAQGAKAKWQWVGLRRKGSDSCPEVPGWEVHDWIQQALSTPRTGKDSCSDPRKQDPRRAADDYRLLQSLGLDRLCVYRATETVKDFELGKRLPAGLVAAQPDRMALAPSTDSALGPAGKVTWQVLADQVLLQTGKKSETGQDPLAPASGGVGRETVPPDVPSVPGVRLVFLDTQPDGEGMTDIERSERHSEHGYTLAHLAQRLVCNESGKHCAAFIATRLALPYAELKSNQAPEPLAQSSGGNLGLVNELAQTIVREVWDWRQSGSRQHLILNLSLGWDGELFGDLAARRVSQLDPAVRAVYDALRFARRHGVLVIAAAGNQRGGETRSKWPLLPAAWELRRPSWFPFVFGPKRVYAVGGVDAQGLPLANSRDGGRPRRTAYGDHAVASTSNPAEPTAIYTGTSVSAAVTSSIAAVVWHLRPELSPAEVMKLLGRSGEALDTRADYYAWKNFWPLSSLIPPPQTTRLSLCSAVKQACGADGSLCGSAAQPSSADCQWQPKAANLSALVPPGTALLGILLEEHPPLHDPMRRWPDIPSRRWLVPTPEDNPCPGCSIVPPPAPLHAALASLSGLSPDDLPQEQSSYSGDHVLAMEINPAWKDETNVTIQSAVLKIVHYSGGQPVSTSIYTIPQNVLSGLTTTAIFPYEIIGETETYSGCTATVDFEVTRGDRSYSFQSPVYVDP